MPSFPGSVGLAQTHPLRNTNPRFGAFPARLGPVTVYPTRWGVAPQIRDSMDVLSYWVNTPTTKNEGMAAATRSAPCA